jgi:two-component system chemotaxis sensor kinase CheA
LVSLGENTEIDKTVVERLGEPLMHMIRNAIDHGIEDPEDRLAAGKSRHGTIILSAEHRGGRFAIEIKDDGRGINRQKVLSKAIEKGLIPESITLNDNEINNLIFLPGFSTASSVTNISGRGVGMDVVKRSIEELGGRVVLTSQEGQGSCFTLMLPLTLAVLDGMVVSVGDQMYIIPLLNIVETMQPSQTQSHHRIGPSDVIHIRGEDLIILRLQDLFDIEATPPPSNESIVVIVETDKNEKLGLIVDRIIGQQQVVIKSIEANYQQIGGISASTILGNGRVALILDVSGLKELSLQEIPSLQQK